MGALYADRKRRHSQNAGNDIMPNEHERCFAFILIIAIFSNFTLSGCAKKQGAGAGMTVNDNLQPQKVYPSRDSTEKAKAILSSAVHLDNLVAGERAPAGEHIWAFNVLLRSAHSREEFTRLFDFGGHYARCYALIGLKMIDDENYRKASQTFGNDKAKRRYHFGCEGMEITNVEFLSLLDAGRIKRKYFEIENFEFSPYFEDRDRFVKDSARFMVDTGFGL